MGQERFSHFADLKSALTTCGTTTRPRIGPCNFERPDVQIRPSHSVRGMVELRSSTDSMTIGGYVRGNEFARSNRSVRWFLSFCQGVYSFMKFRSVEAL